MSDTIKMEYDAMQDMARTFENVKGELEDIKSSMQKISDEIEAGALIGDAGVAFSSAVRDILVPGIQKLADKMNELSGDIRGATDDMRQSDATAAGNF